MTPAFEAAGGYNALVTLLGKVVDRSQPEWRKEQQGLRQRLKEEVPRAVAAHHGYVAQWCQELHTTTFRPVERDAPTVELTFRQVPRRLGVGGKEFDELDVLVEPAHMAVLGDLGAGKTTTLRRLARAVALDSQIHPRDDWQFVVVVVCRDERWDGTGLYEVLGRAVGITGKLVQDLDNPDSRIRQVLDAGCLILIDGLDEVPPRYRSTLERDITQLGRHLQSSKIIVSCRSADYRNALSGFETAEIRPLEPSQAERLIEGLFSHEDAEGFFDALRGHAAAELADRPLFLTYLAAVYKRRGTIPDRPTDVYEAITRLVIQEWDEQRGVRRVSKWAGFGIDDKRRFLADLAYELTRRELFRFEEIDLVKIYDSLADRYELPRAQARLVAQELESHTGLLAQVGDYHYEFSHLALQEFLAADAMVRGAVAGLDGWWKTFPSVAAVSVAMSSDPNRWLHELVARLSEPGDVRPIQGFLDRLGQERPRFIRDANLGGDLLRLLFVGRITDASVVKRLGTIRAVRDSVADGILNNYNSLEVGPATTRAARYDPKSPVPRDALRVPTTVMHTLVGSERLRQLTQQVSAAHARKQGPR